MMYLFKTEGFFVLVKSFKQATTQYILPLFPYKFFLFPVYSFPSRYISDSERPSLPCIDSVLLNMFTRSELFTLSGLLFLSDLYAASIFLHSPFLLPFDVALYGSSSIYFSFNVFPLVHISFADHFRLHVFNSCIVTFIVQHFTPSSQFFVEYFPLRFTRPIPYLSFTVTLPRLFPCLPSDYLFFYIFIEEIS